jgi:hypothetical protein
MLRLPPLVSFVAVFAGVSCVLVVPSRQVGDHCELLGTTTECGVCLAARCQSEIDACCGDAACEAADLRKIEQCAATGGPACTVLREASRKARATEAASGGDEQPTAYASVSESKPRAQKVKNSNARSRRSRECGGSKAATASSRVHAKCVQRIGKLRESNDAKYPAFSVIRLSSNHVSWLKRTNDRQVTAVKGWHWHDSGGRPLA